MFDFEIAVPGLIPLVEIILPVANPTFEIELPIKFGADACPLIFSIDGGNSGDDSQYQPVNGYLNGGNA